MATAETKQPPSQLPDRQKTTADRYRDFLRNAADTMLMIAAPNVAIERLFGKQLRLGTTDALVNTAEGIATVATLGNTSIGEDAGDKVKNFLDGVRAISDGQYEFRMAKGWKMPEGVKYNGLLPNNPNYKGPKAGEEIKDTWVIFLRDKAGNVEALDKSDLRFAHTVGPYIAAQAGIALTVGTKGLTGIKSAVGAASGLPAKAAVATNLAIGSGDMWGGMTQLGHILGNQLVFKPEALGHFGRLIDNPKNLTPEKMMDELNLVLDQYSQRSGRKATQYYIPPLTNPAGAYALLEQLAKGQVQGYVRAGPFAEIGKNAKPEDVGVLALRESAMNNPYFQRSFYGLSIKALQGQSMTESEKMSLRFGMQIMLGAKDIPIVDDTKDSKLDEKVLGLLQKSFARPLVEAQKTKELKVLGLNDSDVKAGVYRYMDLWAKMPATVLPTGEIIDSVKAKLSEADNKIKAEEAKKNHIIQRHIDNPFSLG